MTLLSLDIEDFGACEFALDGTPLPPQTYWHPQRCITQNGISPQRLVLSCALCVPTTQPVTLSLPALASMGSPGPTTCLLLERDSDQRILERALSRASIILGHNIGHDILFLRTIPRFRPLLSPQRLALLDTSVLAHLECDSRPERSLKALLSLFGLYKHPRTLKEGRFTSPLDHDFQLYNMGDAHGTLALCIELSLRLQRLAPQWAGTPASLSYFSACIWSSIFMQEAGTPIHTPTLASLRSHLLRRAAYSKAAALAQFNLLLSGPGSQKPIRRFLSECRTLAPSLFSPHPSDNPHRPHPHHPCLEFTEKQHLLAWSQMNRHLLHGHLPPDHPCRRALLLADAHGSATKSLSTFLDKLLPDGNDAAISPGSYNPDVKIAYSTIYVVPSNIKDDSGSSGGQRQVRPSFKNPATQTWNAEIKSIITSRWPNGFIVHRDQSQHELRVAGVLSGEPSLITAYTSSPPRDLHTDRAIQIFGPSCVTLPTFKTVERQAAKHANFSDLNLCEWATLQHTILDKSGVFIPTSTCCDIIRGRRRARPVLCDWQDRLLAEVSRTHFIELPITGHRRNFIAFDRGAIVNFPVQGIAAATVCAIDHRLRATWLDPDKNARDPFAFLFFNGYDALSIDCKDEQTAHDCKAALEAAERWVEQSGYWALICAHYGHFIPLAGEAKLIPAKP